MRLGGCLGPCNGEDSRRRARLVESRPQSPDLLQVGDSMLILPRHRVDTRAQRLDDCVNIPGLHQPRRGWLLAAACAAARRTGGGCGGRSGGGGSSMGEPWRQPRGPRPARRPPLILHLLVVRQWRLGEQHGRGPLDLRRLWRDRRKARRRGGRRGVHRGRRAAAHRERCHDAVARLPRPGSCFMRNPPFLGQSRNVYTRRTSHDHRS